MTTERMRPSATAVPALTWGVRVAALLSVLSILWQGYSASAVIVSGDPALGPHEAGAVVAHVVTGLLALAAAAQWRSTRGTVWPTAVSVVVFVATFVEASLGHRRSLWIHVPLALLIMLGVASVVVWSFSRAAADTRHR